MCGRSDTRNSDSSDTTPRKETGAKGGAGTLPWGPAARATRLGGRFSSRNPRDTAYAWRAADPAFRAVWDDAYQEGGDAIEAEAHRRAVEGWEEPVFQGGAQVGVVRRYSDRLLDRLLKGRKPDVYGERVGLSAPVHSGQPDDMTIRIVYTSRSANGEELPDMEESELHAFWRWRDEQLRSKAAAQGNGGDDAT